MDIEFIQIHDYNLDISKRLNYVINKLDNNWICLTDQDTLKFEGFANNLKHFIENADITKNDLIGTRANRLRPTNNQVINSLFNESNIDVHNETAKTLWQNHALELQTTNLIAGSCMIFHKELWHKIGGFNESKIFFDKYFSYDVIDKGGRCLIAKGLYIFHLYRWGRKDPVSSVEHLVK
jgi:GT2 family glycosyltransferase